MKTLINTFAKPKKIFKKISFFLLDYVGYMQSGVSETEKKQIGEVGNMRR